MLYSIVAALAVSNIALKELREELNGSGGRG